MKKTQTCCICGEPCNGKMKIRVRKNKDYIFCPFHFQRYEFTPLKEIRRLIKESKLLLKKCNIK